MLATKQFKSALGLIRKYDESMKSALSACYAYTLWQWHNGKNKNPHGELTAALNEAKGFLSEIAPKLTLGKRDAALNEAGCTMRAEVVIGDLFRGREAKKAERAEAKKARDAEKAKLAEQNERAEAKKARDAEKAKLAEAKKARDAEKAKLAEQNAAAGAAVDPGHAGTTPDVVTIDGEAIAVEVEHALVIDGVVVTLSQSEVIAMRDYLTLLRTPALKAA